MPKTSPTPKKENIFEVNTPEVVAEVIEGELVAIHLGDGYYYHGNTIGSYIWTLLTHNYTVGEIIEHLGTLTSLESSKLQKEVTEYIRKLHKEKLIRLSGKRSVTPLTAPLAPLTTTESPTLKKHEDMKELLLLDPIHDVGDQNWPLTDVG